MNKLWSDRFYGNLSRIKYMKLKLTLKNIYENVYKNS